jgi:murein DD-endopeptidase MepM/ murein hydrolase activator NlpD
MLFPLHRGPLSPLPGVLYGWRVTSYFGGRIHPITGRPGNHGGMDLAYWGCEGEPIIAPCSGRVTQSWDRSGGGNWTGLAGDDGCYWGFGHASRFAGGVNGRHVGPGAVLAYVGNTGGSSGAHLHVAYRPPGALRYGDPYDLLYGSSLAGEALLVTVGADPLYALERDWFAMANDDDLRRIVREELLEIGIRSLQNVETNLAGVIRQEGVETRQYVVNIQDNLAGVTRAEGAETRLHDAALDAADDVELAAVTERLVSAIEQVKADGSVGGDLDAPQLAAAIAPYLTVSGTP